MTRDIPDPEPGATDSRRAPEPGPAFRSFAAGYPFELDAYQREGCAHVEAGRGVLVAAPTGAGKTVVGEFAVYLALLQGRKCFYTTPIKALSNQKYRDLVERHGEERVGLLTGDTSINSEAPVVVMTTEVLRNMIYAASRTLDGLGFVVMDEVHYLADRFRGPVWEEVIIGLAESVQVVSLSATVSNAEEFGDWLDEVRGDVAVVLSERRPVPLFQHVMAGRRLYDLFDDEAPTASELPVKDATVNPELTRLAKEEARGSRDDSRRPRGRGVRGKIEKKTAAGFRGARQGPNLVPRRDGAVEKLDAEGLLPAIYFIFSRQGCDQAVAQLLHSNVRLTNANERAQLDEIAARHVAGLSVDDLEALGWSTFAEAFRRGIASHHAGLLPAFKECVEEGFVKGLVKVVFATETLALGINMPARSVVLEKLVKFNGETHAEITPGEYTQLTGRAGRRGIDVEGHAIVLWHRMIDPRSVAGLASRRTYPLRSSFTPTYNMAVNMVATVGRERARVLLEQSFAQYQSDKSVVGLARGMARNAERIERLWAKAGCERGDFEEYAHLREQVSRLQAEAARSRKADRRAETMGVLLEVVAGDILRVPSGRHEGWAVVIDPGQGRDGPRPLVLTEERQVKRLSIVDFPTPPVVAGRMRIPKHFSAKEPASRRNLSAAFRSKLATIDLTASRYHPGAMDAEVASRIDEIRQELADHPCHGCPDREVHARVAEDALRLERENASLQRQSEKRTNTIAVKFDRICSVLEALGYLTPGGAEVTSAGRVLSRIYGELDLVTAECVRAGVFDELGAAELASVISGLVYESRGGDQRRPARMPNRTTEIAQASVRTIWREVGLLERDHRLESNDPPDIGLAEPLFWWASGGSLADVLESSGLTAGDFVRWTRMVIDLAGQLADAAGPGDLRGRCREAISLMRRGVVDVAYDEDD